MRVNFDDSQRTFCQSDSEFVRLLAPAGSGKTLSLLWRCRWLYEKHSNIRSRFLVFTFTRAARDELKDRLINDPDFVAIQNVVKVETLNQWGYNYLKSTEKSLTIKNSRTENFFLVKNLLRPIWIEHPKIAKVLENNSSKYPDIIDVFNELKSSGFQHIYPFPAMQKHFDLQVNWLKQNGLERYFETTVTSKLNDIGLLVTGHTLSKQFEPFLGFWSDACNHLWKSAVISLDDQKYWALLKLQERYRDTFYPEMNRYHHIMVDEFQDINPLDLFLIRELVRINRATLTIVGDDDQAIFEWRGSTPSFILKPDIHFYEKFHTYILSANYRSPANIVDLSQRLIVHNKNRVTKAKPSCANSDKAEIITKTFTSHNESLDFVIDLAIQANQSRKPKQLAIIGRKKSQIIPIQILLTSRNIPYYAKEDLNVLLSDAFDDLRELLFAIAEKSNRRNSKDVASSLITFCNYVGLYPLKKDQKDRLYGFLVGKQPRNLLEALHHFQNYDGPLFAKNSTYYTAINSVIESNTVSDAIQEIGQQFKGMQKHYGKSDDDIFFKEPPFFYLAEFAKRYNDDFWGFIDQIENVISVMRNASDNNGDDIIDNDLKNSVHIMTALRAKGKEFDTVVLLDVNDGIWPNKLNTENDADLEQERRVFYVAVTRPRRKLVLLTVQSIAGKLVRESPYIAEMGLPLNSTYLPKLSTTAISPDIVTSRANTTPIPKIEQPIPQGKTKQSNSASYLLLEAFRQCNGYDGDVLLADLGATLLRIDPTFKSSNYGYNKLIALIKAYPNLMETGTNKKGAVVVRLVRN